MSEFRALPKTCQEPRIIAPCKDLQRVRKKEIKLFLVISSIKLWRCWGNLVHSFLNKFATTPCTRFSPHLNNVYTTLWVVTERKSRIYPTSTVVCLQIHQIWIQLITACRNYCKRRCTKYVSLIWSYRRRHWRMAVAMTTWSNLAHSVLSRCFSWCRLVMRILYTYSCNSPHTL